MAFDTPTLDSTLDDWLAWLETIHPKSIELGLERFAMVADRLHLQKPSKPFVLVGGTNGKGSTVAMLSRIYLDAGYQVGTYTSPHIESFQERICINNKPVDDRTLVNAFAAIKEALAPQTLTYFEFTTLAAMWIVERSPCDVYVFEVGLGGRLDATNYWDADCAVLTSIALDHQEYLGNDRSTIATEKAAIGRPGKLLVVGDEHPPASLPEYTSRNDIRTQFLGEIPVSSLPATSLPGVHQRRNAACALAVIEELQPDLPVEIPLARNALKKISIPARFEQARFQGVDVVKDVAHNPAGAQALANAWQEQFGQKKAHIIFACLADKDLQGIVNALAPIAVEWHCVPIEAFRAYPAGELANLVSAQTAQKVTDYTSISDAWTSARSKAIKHQQAILVAGSFYTISLVSEALN